MDNEPKGLMDDTYRLFVPIENDGLLKSVQVDENGDYIVQGVMTSDDKDEEDDSISPDGMDCSYFLQKGWIKYEHGNSPNQFIGEPIEVKVGRFTHPALQKSVNGVYVKGRLFAQRELARQAVAAIEDLQKSHTSRKMGWSIEGNVKERDRKSGKIVKSVLRNVVLTMNPVNTMTWAELAKSFAKNHELTIDTEDDINKAMDLGTEAPVVKQSLEGAKKKEEPEDEQMKFIRLFREFAKSRFLNKSLRRDLLRESAGALGIQAYDFAVDKGFEEEAAFDFAEYIAGRADILKSIYQKSLNYGGEGMENLANLLDTDLDELKKSLETDDEDEDDEKSEEEPEKEPEKAKKVSKKPPETEDEGTEDEESEEDEGGEEGEEKEEEEEKGKKSIQTDFAKSLNKDEENAKALEVSDFLASLTDEIGYHMDGFEKSMASVAKQQSAITKSLISTATLIKTLTEKVESLEAKNADLEKSLNEVLEKPVGRKSVVSTREITTIKKSENAGGGALTRAQVEDVLMKSFDAGEIAGNVITRFESGIGIDSLGLPDTVKQKLGL